MTIRRILGFILTPVGILVGAWVLGVLGEEDLTRGGWITLIVGGGMAFALVVVGVRYLLSPSKEPDAGDKS
ncbi:MAG: hypothetical protein PVI23_08285 [Maricaulaceae bacterium]|jgi:hypothetical protein